MKRKINRIRKFKYYFYKYGIHKVLPGDRLIFLGHLSRLSRWISENKGLGFSNFPTKNFDYQDRFKLFQGLWRKRYIFRYEYWHFACFTIVQIIYDMFLKPISFWNYTNLSFYNKKVTMSAIL